MTNPFSINEYVDCKNNKQQWWIARVVKIDGDFVKLRFDGATSDKDIDLRFASPRIAPFRKHTRGYTGFKKSLRDDPELDISCIDEVSGLIDTVLMTDCMKFDAKDINRCIRGRIFLFTDALLSKEYPENFEMDIYKATEYLQKYMGFLTIYLSRFDKLSYAYTEGVNNLDALLTKPDVAYSHFIHELFESLKAIFGEEARCRQLYDFMNNTYHLDEFALKYNIKAITRSASSSKDDSSPNSVENGDILEEHAEKNADEADGESKYFNFENMMIEHFNATGGFKALLNLIYTDDNENGVHDTSFGSMFSKGDSMNKEEDPSINIMSLKLKYGCPISVVVSIIFLYDQIREKLKEDFALELIIDIKERAYKRIRTMSDIEIKELDLDDLKELYDKLEEVIESLESEELLAEFYQFREIQELNIFLRFIHSSSFERKLKGINGIREFARSIAVHKRYLDDSRIITRRTFKYLDSNQLTQWILSSRLLELIYGKHYHIELIKKSIDILKFIAEFADTFPESVIDLLWDSCKDKNEEVLKVMFEKIVEIASCLDIDAAQRMYSKFTTVKWENYHEDLIDLIGKFTQKCLRLVIPKTADGVIRTNEVSPNQEEYQFFGIPLLFELIMDDTPVSAILSEQALVHLREIISDFPDVKIFINLTGKCVENIQRNISTYQSLVVLKELLISMQKFSINDEFSIEYFKLFEEKYTIIDELVKCIELYWQQITQILQARRASQDQSYQVAQRFQYESLIGKFSHEQNIFERLDSLKYFSAHAFLKTALSTEQLKHLWRIFVLEPNFIFETRMFLQTISKQFHVIGRGNLLLISPDCIKDVLIEILCNKNYLDLSTLGLEKFNCLEFYFTHTNLQEGKLIQGEIEEPKVYGGSNNVLVTADKDLIGLSYIWSCLIECSEKEVLEKLTALLVNIYIRLSTELKQHQLEVHGSLINDIMTSIEEFLEHRNVKAIERYVLFLDRFIEKFEKRRSPSFYKSGYNSNVYTYSAKTNVIVQLQPYNITERFEFQARDKLGYVKERVSLEFGIDSSRFDLNIEGKSIPDDELFKDLWSFYSVGEITVLMTKKPDNNEVNNSVKHLLVSNRRYIDIIFKMFSTLTPGDLKLVWDFTCKLPIQEDVKNDFKEKGDYSNLLNGVNQINDENIYQINYYLSIIRELSLTDDYYLRIRNSDLSQVRSEWTQHFINNKGLQWLISLLLETDFSQISNYLYIKTILSLFTMIRMYLRYYSLLAFINNSSEALERRLQKRTL